MRSLSHGQPESVHHCSERAIPEIASFLEEPEDTYHLKDKDGCESSGHRSRATEAVNQETESPGGVQSAADLRQRPEGQAGSMDQV